MEYFTEVFLYLLEFLASASFLYWSFMGFLARLGFRSNLPSLLATLALAMALALALILDLTAILTRDTISKFKYY